MSRAYNARRKARRQAQAAAERARPRRPSSLGWRYTTLAPILVIAAIFAVVGVLGFGAAAGISKKQVDREVKALLDGIPQKGAALGSPRAPITVWMFADLECPTVKLFVEKYLPSVIGTWVRTGVVRLDYRSLETDTLDEEIFFKQEAASLAAGRQNRMWNFVLTFVRQQGEVRTDYATDEFLADIASQVPGLGLGKWQRDRVNPRLSKQVALSVHSGRSSGLRYTPSLLVGFTAGEARRHVDRASIKKEVAASLEDAIGSLRREEVEDSPTIRTVGPGAIGG